MIRTMFFVLALALFLVPAIASAQSDVFTGVPADGAWRQVQNGDVAQWSAIPAGDHNIRIDLISYIEGGNRTSYYLFRAACADGTVGSTVIATNHTLGIGRTCGGRIVLRTAKVLGEVRPLPPDATKLISPE